ncbi:MAG: sigma-70 family RNA polymerase sigma factor [Planctomycetota bacterium]
MSMDSEIASDAEIVHRVLAGDADAYEGLVRRYQERLYRAAWKILGNEDDARDVAQEAFIRVYRRLDRFDTSRRFYTWIYRIAYNLSVDRMRQRSRAGRSPLSADFVDPSDGPDAGVLGDELRREVREVLEELPPRYRALLILRDVEGKSGKDISDLSGVGHATVRWRIHRARKLFRQAWERRLARGSGGRP